MASGAGLSTAEPTTPTSAAGAAPAAPFGELGGHGRGTASTDDRGGHGRFADTAMTPMNKRRATEEPTAAGCPSSPEAKRAQRRSAAPPPQQGMIPSLTVEGLTVEVHKLFLQSQKDQEHFDATTAQINDHATLIDENYKRLRDANEQLQRDVKQVAAEAHQ